MERCKLRCMALTVVVLSVLLLGWIYSQQAVQPILAVWSEP